MPYPPEVSVDFTAARQFTLYGPSHWAVLLVFAAGATALVVVGCAYREVTGVRRVERWCGVVLFALQLGITLYSLGAARSLADAVPLQLSDLVTFTAAYALWSRKQWAFALTYYWGLVLSTQALVSPILRGPDFPDRDFLVFWGMHLLVVWTAIYLTWGVGLRPSWGDFRVTVAITACWAAVAMAFNGVTGTNYGFLNRKPATGSILDVLGPWPWYLIPEMVLIIATWGLLTWPFTRSRAVRRG